MITNDGAILAPTGTGLALNEGATVTNFQDGTISAQDYGIELENAVGTVANEGSLNGNQNDGAALFLGGSISNASTGTITGYGGVAMIGRCRHGHQCRQHRRDRQLRCCDWPPATPIC